MNKLQQMPMVEQFSKQTRRLGLISASTWCLVLGCNSSNPGLGWEDGVNGSLPPRSVMANDKVKR